MMSDDQITETPAPGTPTPKPPAPRPPRPVVLTEDEVVERYKSFVEGIAAKTRKHFRLSAPLEDMIAYGYAGLIEAHRRFEPDDRASFTSFAYYRVRGAIIDGCRKEGWAPRDRQIKLHHIGAANEHLESNHRANLQAPAARSLGESIDRVSRMVGDVITIMLVRQSDLERILVQENTPQDRHNTQQTRERLIRKGLDALDEQERMIILRHHMEEEPLASIARELGLSTSWLSRMHARALEKMRDALADEELP